MAKKQEPLTESYYYILLCLYQGANHGYGIMHDTAEFSNGRVKIGSGTMYGATGNMMKKGWIIEKSDDDPDHDRRRMYELTDAGREVLIQEIMRLKELVASAKEIVKD